MFIQEVKDGENIMVNVQMVRGDSETFTIDAEDDDGPVLFVTGDKVYLTVKRDKRETVNLIQKIATTFPNGKAYIDILPADTKNLDYRVYVWDIQVTFANGEIKTPVKESLFELTGEVTHE